jgi:hypothetical protein
MRVCLGGAVVGLLLTWGMLSLDTFRPTRPASSELRSSWAGVGI